jgi:hypothetical protein
MARKPPTTYFINDWAILYVLDDSMRCSGRWVLNGQTRIHYTRDILNGGSAFITRRGKSKIVPATIDNYGEK